MPSMIIGFAKSALRDLKEVQAWSRSRGCAPSKKVHIKNPARSLRPSLGATLRAAYVVQIIYPDDLSLRQLSS